MEAVPSALSENVTIATINAVASVIGAVITAGLGFFVVLLNRKVKRVGKDAAEAREQVANDHVDAAGKPINLRVESDHRHYENRQALAEIRGGLRTLGNVMQDGFSTLQAQLEEHRGRIQNIEDTAPHGAGRHRQHE